MKTHINSLLSKLGVSDRTQAAITALRRGLVQLELVSDRLTFGRSLKWLDRGGSVRMVVIAPVRIGLLGGEIIFRKHVIFMQAPKCDAPDGGHTQEPYLHHGTLT